MEKLRRNARPLSYLVLSGFVAFTLHGSAAQAALVGTEAVLATGQAAPERARLHALLDREQVKSALLARGVDPARVEARVDRMTDQEAQLLSNKIDELPAGGDVLGLAVFVFLVLLVTDIAGFTDIFRFVKKPGRR